MILVINPGSSSLKYKLYEHSSNILTCVASGSVNNISGKPGNNHATAAKDIAIRVRKDYPKIDYVGYRIVHGGAKLDSGAAVSSGNLKILERYSLLAPLHNPAAIETIKTLLPLFGRAKHLMFFDTDFFDELPEVEKTYPIDLMIVKKFEIRRYGFHGISHKQIMLAVDPKKKNNLITVHLGAGCSIAAIKAGKPIATSLGFTPDEGLIMQTRSGDLDPGLVLYLAEELGLKATRDLIERKSGLKGLTDSDGDMLDILYLAGEKIEDREFSSKIERTLLKRERAILALEKYVRQIMKYIAYYSMLLGHVDTLAFGGKIGYGSSVIRNRVTNQIKKLPIDEFAKVAPDEEMAIAREILEKTQ